ncbi:metalloregulator ArsR/SmtB family transcription factor [Rossellomorea marisflavi]|uniref:ArsR family transcriptional regulator n=1 Tax=Rossellomorea marisflavi TaxID=189381 RepID=A0A165KM61_9BACI|nr:metalloregulator ArsR/SmtB family transcription factor [Rossellomorea marisflavi]KZE49604.1 ArsR family transcriptional regulator [Rossellomorea marisflavi]
MQLNKQVEFHKTLGDPTRLKIIYLLSEGPLHVGALAGKLGLTAPTISHHLSRLKDCNLVYSRREKNTVYYHLNIKVLLHHGKVLQQFAEGTKGEERNMDQRVKEKQKVLNAFIGKDGKVSQLPAQQKKRLYLLEHFVEALEVGRKYEEKEINEYIKRFHDDYATVRREFIIHQFMFRENSIYERNPKEMWASVKQ